MSALRCSIKISLSIQSGNGQFQFFLTICCYLAITKPWFAEQKCRNPSENKIHCFPFQWTVLYFMLTVKGLRQINEIRSSQQGNLNLWITVTFFGTVKESYKVCIDNQPCDTLRLSRNEKQKLCSNANKEMMAKFTVTRAESPLTGVSEKSPAFEYSKRN